MEDRQSIEINRGIERITKEEFAGCLADVIILPDTIKKIDDEAFENCTELREIIFLGIPEHLGKNLFDGCINLCNIVIKGKSFDLSKIGLDWIPNGVKLILRGDK